MRYACAETVSFVQRVMHDNFPGGPATVPFHSRWRHFESGGVDRVAALVAGPWAGVDPLERARRMIDLAVVRTVHACAACARWPGLPPCAPAVPPPLCPPTHCTARDLRFALDLPRPCAYPTGLLLGHCR
jgi:hypothetical protein